MAIPAKRGIIPMPQPDGTVLSTRLVGDEFYHYNTTADGYTIMLNEAGAYVYAQRQGNTIVPTQVMAHDEGQRSADEIELISSLSKGLIDQTAVARAQVERVRRDVDMADFDLENFRGCVILVDFSDMTFSADDPQAFYTEMFSKDNFDGFTDPVTGREVDCLGSVRDYFNDQSDGKFVPPFDVYGPYTSTRKATECRNNAAAIFATAAKNANNVVDFTKYDNNNDGKIDMIYFLVAGYASSSGNNEGYLWPHASTLAYRYLSLDGKWADRYASSCELYGYESNPSSVTVEGIGTICHEFSHVLGLPDFYDTDYSDNGQSHHPGGWDLMAGGTDYNYGRTPCGYTLFERYALGWAQPQTITNEGHYTLEAVNSSFDGYILRSPVAREFFTIENRQKTDWDAYIPGHGMIITRVDSTNTNVWYANTINCNPAHNYFELLRAANTSEDDLSSDPFPGSEGVPMITNTTYPSLTTWAGYENDFNIANITETDGVISFDVVNDRSLQALVEDFEGMTANSSTSDKNIEGNFATWNFTKSGVRAPGEGKAEGTNSVLMKLPCQLYTSTPIYYNCYLASLTAFNTSSSTTKYTLEYSTDDGATWTKALTLAGATQTVAAAKTTVNCYWKLNLTNKQPALFRIAQVAGNKSASTYIDDFTIYYTGEEGGPSTFTIGDVNNDGEVNIADVNMLIDIIMGGEADADTLVRCDVNEDQEINVADVNSLIGIILQ